MSGFPAHWNKKSNPAWAFDVWFLNLFPRSEPFRDNGEGYATLSFIPTLATMILGLIAGGILKRERPPWFKFAWLLVAGTISLALGWGLGELGICPVVKRIWTPSWVLFSGGICLFSLAFFWAVIDWLGWGLWSFPLRVIGANSIAAYCLSHLIEGFISDSFKTHLGLNVFNLLGAAYAPFLQGVAVLLVLWLPLLDVSPQAVLEDLRLPSRFDGPASPDVLTKPVLSRPAAPFTSAPGLGTIIELTTVRSINSPQSSLASPTLRPSFWSPPNNNQHWMVAQCSRYVKSFQESATGIFFPLH